MSEQVVSIEPFEDPGAPLTIGGLATPMLTEAHHFDTGWGEMVRSRIIHTNYAARLGIEGADEYLAMEERELRFFHRVYEAGLEMAEGHDAPVVLLFDVDQTVSEINDQGERVVRPAFQLVAGALRAALGDRLRIGLLTTVDSRHVRDTCFEGIDPDSIADEFVIDVRRYFKKPGFGLDVEEIAQATSDEMLERVGTVLHPVLEQGLADGRLAPQAVYSEGKFEIMNNLQTNPQPGYEQARYLLIDNMLYADMINPYHPYLRGLHVGSEIQGAYYRDTTYPLQLRQLEKSLMEAGIRCEALSAICQQFEPVVDPKELARLRRARWQQTHTQEG